VMLALILFIFDVALRRIDLSVWFPSANAKVTSTVSRVAKQRPNPPAKSKVRAL